MMMVSVICCAYNHEKYIRRTLDGFIMQKTSFPFEVLVHDDASNDDTANIIREYEKKYPKIIKPIYESENQYSKHDGSLERIQYGRACGKYIAICEGDDYWTDPSKLQKQFDAMEVHPEIDMCAHGAIIIDAVSHKEVRTIAPSETDTILSPESTILGDGGFLSTNSLFFRAELTKPENIPPFMQHLRIDYTMQIQGSLRGGILYLHDLMSVYMLHVPGSWSERNKDKEKMMEFNRRKNQVLLELDEYTNFKFTKVIHERILKNEYLECIDLDKGKEALSKQYRRFYKDEPLKNKIKIRIKAYFPGLVKIYRRNTGR